MTQPTPPGVTPPAGLPARAPERPPRCGRPKNETGRPCRRNAGKGTDHYGEGPCADHDDGSWQRVTFAENAEAREAFLEAVAGQPYEPTRALIEPLGYRKRDVTELEAADEEFRCRLEEARGQDAESIRREAHRRAVAKESDRILEVLMRMKLPEAAVLRQSQTRVDGQIDVRPVYGDFSSLSLEGIAEERQRQLAECKTEFEVVRCVLGWVNPPPGEVPKQGRPALELVSGSGS